MTSLRKLRHGFTTKSRFIYVSSRQIYAFASFKLRVFTQIRGRSTTGSRQIPFKADSKIHTDSRRFADSHKFTQIRERFARDSQIHTDYRCFCEANSR